VSPFTNRKGIITARNQCLHFACWIPHTINMFCSLNDTFHIVMLMEEEEASKVLDSLENEDIKAQRDQVLSYVYDFRCSIIFAF